MTHQGRRKFIDCLVWRLLIHATLSIDRGFPGVYDSVVVRITTGRNTLISMWFCTPSKLPIHSHETWSVLLTFAHLQNRHQALGGFVVEPNNWLCALPSPAFILRFPILDWNWSFPLVSHESLPNSQLLHSCSSKTMSTSLSLPSDLSHLDLSDGDLKFIWLNIRFSSSNH